MIRLTLLVIVGYLAFYPVVLLVTAYFHDMARFLA